MIVALTLFIVLGLWAVVKIGLGLTGIGLFTGSMAETDEKDAKKMAKDVKGCWGSIKMFAGGTVQLLIAVIGIIATTW